MILQPSTGQKIIGDIHVHNSYMQEWMCICKDVAWDFRIQCWLLEVWITLPSEEISIQWVAQYSSLALMSDVCRIKIYPLDRIICPLNNWVLLFFWFKYHKELHEEAQFKVIWWNFATSLVVNCKVLLVGIVVPKHQPSLSFM